MENDEYLPEPVPDGTEPSHVQRIENQVRELARLRDDGMLTYEEFAAKKADLLAQL